MFFPTGEPVTENYLDDDEDALRPMIHRAAGRGDVETATKLLDADPSQIHTRNELNNQPLHEACWAKHDRMVRLLIERGAEVNVRGDFGETPLHYAVRDGGEEANPIIKLLVECGADVNATDERLNETPLGFAIREDQDELQPSIETLRAAQP
jgi:ankyrin repeat protein